VSSAIKVIATRRQDMARLLGGLARGAIRAPADTSPLASLRHMLEPASVVGLQWVAPTSQL
jgi:hypothetical protein